MVAQALREQIDSGEISDGLPSEAALMRSLSVSRNTVRRALKLLESEQVVESVPGVGWRIPSNNDRRSLAERMAALITESSLGLGDTYPSESKLCERFGASRTAVRRALAHLEGIGLLDTTHGKGRTVRALPASPEQP
ncbi:GntR family transcriptional regulator [Streptomyces roseoviridis]|uniref:GntR family transcriptional regulator n=1 Tax=Streptomyces roseoviridis TaxID=67361 RepID=UPI0031EFCA92